MKIILTKAVDGVGEVNEVVQVKDGFARNFLIPQGFAAPATGKSINYLESLKRSKARRKDHLLAQAEQVGKQLGGTTVTIAKQAGTKDRIFGTVTAKDVAIALEGKGFKVDRRIVQVAEPIKSLGSYTVTVRLHAQVQVPVTVEVVRAS